VTNGMTDNQLGKIRNTSLDKYVDAWCISDDVGIRKPDPRMFWAAAERCGAHAEFGGWIVGNSLALDIDGGAHAGLRTVWLTELALPASRPSVDRPPSGSCPRTRRSPRSPRLSKSCSRREAGLSRPRGQRSRRKIRMPRAVVHEQLRLLLGGLRREKAVDRNRQGEVRLAAGRLHQPLRDHNDNNDGSL
jgi:hypothetical protein